MDDTLVATVWEDVSDRVGSDLRVVTRFESSDFETRMRDDVRDRYTSAEDRRVVDDTIVEQLLADDIESSFKAGDLEAVVSVFDEAWVLSWTRGPSRKSGFILSIERGGQNATMGDLEWCLRYLDEEIAPLLE